MKIHGILFAASSPDRTRVLLEELTACGWTDVRRFDLSRGDALAHVRATDPMAVVLDLGVPDRILRDQAFRLARTGRWPVVIFTDHSDDEMTEAAMTAGVAGYVVNGLAPGRVCNVVQTAVSRFRQMERLRRERDEAVSAFDAVWCPVGR
jgi:response regulator NasT